MGRSDFTSFRNDLEVLKILDDIPHGRKSDFIKQAIKEYANEYLPDSQSTGGDPAPPPDDTIDPDPQLAPEAPAGAGLNPEASDQSSTMPPSSIKSLNSPSEPEPMENSGSQLKQTTPPLRKLVELRSVK